MLCGRLMASTGIPFSWCLMYPAHVKDSGHLPSAGLLAALSEAEFVHVAFPARSDVVDGPWQLSVDGKAYIAAAPLRDVFCAIPTEES